MKARTVGPVLLILFGVAALFAPSSGALPVGGQLPPCESQVGDVQCPPPVTIVTGNTTTTTAPATTETTVAETTVPETTVPVTEPPSTLVLGVVVAPPTTSAVAPASTTPVTVAHVSGELARTGSNTLSSTLIGIAMISFGFVLLALGRRRTRSA